MVETTAESFAADPESTISAIHSPADGPFRDKELYVVVINLNGTVIAHGYNPTIAGIDIEYLSDTRGGNIGDLIEENLSVYGRWVEYYWPNPISDLEDGEPKLNWYRIHGDHIFGAGTYPASLG
jgi:signal transduction histidine kinase